MQTEYQNTNIAFSPSVVNNAIIAFKLSNYAEARWVSKYVSRQYLDNTGRNNRSLDPFLVQELTLNLNLPVKNLKKLELIIRPITFGTNYMLPMAIHIPTILDALNSSTIITTRWQREISWLG